MPQYDYRPLAQRYANQLPPGSPYDWEDIYQEMCIKQWQHPSAKSLHWAAKRIIRDEWVRFKKVDLDWTEKHVPRLDVICETYRLIEKWPWLLGLLVEGSLGQLALHVGVSPGAIGRRLNRVRAHLGLAKRYSK